MFYKQENNMSESYLEIQLDHQPIELCKLLKIADLVTGGGEAKVVISEGYVLLNGEVEYQKRKKIYHNDIVEFNGETIQVIINENLHEDDLSITADIDADVRNVSDVSKVIPLSEHTKVQQHDKHVQKSSSHQGKQEKAAPTNEGTAKQNKRKPISF